MKSFRIAKCLNDNGIGSDRYVIFKDGSRKKMIQTDENGNEFIYVDNWIQSDPDMDEFNSRSLSRLIKYSFMGKPKDMIMSIRRGYGDAICVSSFFTRTEHVKYYLDRKIGDRIRSKSIEGWEGTKFCYGLYYNSCPLNTSGKYDWGNKDTYYASIEEAKQTACRLVDDAFYRASTLVGFPWDDNAPYIKFLDEYAVDPHSDLTFELLEDVHKNGDVFRFKEGISKRYLLNKFRIVQKVDDRND